MKALNKEIVEFIEAISKKEKQENPRLKQRISALLKSLSELNQKFNKGPQEIASNSQGVLKYLNKKMLN